MRPIILSDYVKVLLNSADWYLEKINNKDYDGIDKEALVVSAIINSWSALEAFINYIASVAKYANRLAEHERTFLNEKKLRINDNGQFVECREYYSTATKILFLLNRFSSVSSKNFKQTKLWEKIKISEDLRNNLIHPKENLSSAFLNKEKAKLVNDTVKETIKYLNRKTLKAKSII